MAYVQFWKGLAADYNAASHQDGIYQCTDTGDTYIFGVLNSGSAGGGTEDYVTQEELTQGLAGKANTNHTHSNASTTAAGFLRQLNGSTSQYLRGDGQWATPPDTNTTYSNATTSQAGLMSAADKTKLNNLKAPSSSSRTSGVSSINLASYSVWLRYISSNATMSFTGSLSNGQECHIIVENTSSSARTLTLPSSSTYVNMTGDSVEIPGNGYAEINVLRANNIYYIRAAASV